MALSIQQNRIHAPRLLLAVVIYFLGVVLSATAIYVISRHEYMSGIDARLVAVANNLPKILPTDFHDGAISADSIRRTEDQMNMDKMSRHVATGGFAYLYIYVIQHGTVYFTSSSYAADDLKYNNVSYYWTDYPEGTPVFWTAMQSGKPLFDTYTDRWGTFRSVLVRFQSPQGNYYVAAADINISIIKDSLRWTVFVVFIVGLLMLGLTVRSNSSKSSELKSRPRNCPYALVA